MIVRRAAADALNGSFVTPRKRYERHQRRHDHVAHLVLNTRLRSSATLPLRCSDAPCLASRLWCHNLCPWLVLKETDDRRVLA